jgi:hypothetical protein
MIEIELLLIIIIIAAIVIDHRLYKLVKIQREIHKEHLLANSARTEIVKALQWMVDNWRKD